MSNYMIFVVLLTIAYIIYYGYNINKDLYGKKAEEKGEEVETFEVDDMEPVVATPVRESEDGGFSLGSVPSSPLIDTSAETMADDDASDSAEAKKMIDTMSGRFEEAETYSEGGVTYTELDEMIAARDPKLKFVPSIRQQRDIF